MVSGAKPARPTGNLKTDQQFNSWTLRQLRTQLLVAERPTDATRDVLQTQDMEIFPVHAGNAV
jgi:hypothetical protein